MDTLQPQKNTKKESVAGLAGRSADSPIVDLKSKLYSIRDTAKKIQQNKPELHLYEAMDIAWNEYVAKDELTMHVENLKKIGQIKIPGTSIPLPPFDFDDPHVRVWLNERLLQFKKRNSKLTYRGFLEMIARKTVHYAGKVSHIDDEEFLSIDEGKITAWAPDLWEMEEFDWDDPENQKWLKEEEEKRIKKYGRLTSEQYDKIIDLKEALLKEEPTLPGEKAFDLAWKKVTGKKIRAQEN